MACTSGEVELPLLPFCPALPKLVKTENIDTAALEGTADSSFAVRSAPGVSDTSVFARPSKRPCTPDGDEAKVNKKAKVGHPSAK